MDRGAAARFSTTSLFPNVFDNVLSYAFELTDKEDKLTDSRLEGVDLILESSFRLLQWFLA